MSANTDPTHDPEAATDQWEADQQQWQQLLQSFVDAAATDDQFLMHVGNAMRGSLLAGKPYPGTELAPSTPNTTTIDELIFAVRRLEGQISDLVATVEALQTVSVTTEAPRGHHT